MRDFKIMNLEVGSIYFYHRDEQAITEFETEKIKPDGERDNQKIADLSKKIFSFTGIDYKISTADKWKFYKGTLADSLMARKLRELAEAKEDTSSIVSKKSASYDYCDIVINLTFEKDIMIQDGSKMKKVYDPEKEEIVDSDKKKMKKLIGKKRLREIAYRDGITINGKKYVDFQRSSSKARTGNDLFILEEYYEEMNQWQKMNMPFETDSEADIVSIRAYESLVSSSIIGTVVIEPESILLIDDVSSSYTMPCNVVRMAHTDDSEGQTNKSSRKHLEAVYEPYTQSTDLWDGQSLLDKAVFESGTYEDKDGNIHSYSGKGFLLLRNRFFKSAVFNTNLQDYYRENGIETVKDMFGNSFNASDIKLVTTPNSVKIFKFADKICSIIPDEQKEHLSELEAELNEKKEEYAEICQTVSTLKRKITIATNKGKDTTELEAELTAVEEKKSAYESEIKSLEKPVKTEQKRLTWNWYREQIKEGCFGVCKYEKASKFGDRQQLWYQVIGSLNFSKEDLGTLVLEQIKEVNLIKQNVAWFKHFIGGSINLNTVDNMMLALLNINDDMAKTKWYKDYRRSRIQGILDRLKMGKIQIENSDFRVLVGNPFEMLVASTGEEIKDSILHDFECYCTAFEDNEELYGFRSPHICSGNSALLKNTNRPEWKWFNFTDNIIAINFWGKGAFISPIWNGCDTDSDVAFIGNDKIILNKVKEVFGSETFAIPINGENPKAKILKYQKETLARVDAQLCNDFIGRVCNLGRDLQSFYWHIYNTGNEVQKGYLKQIYDDICICEVLSNIAIDSAKREYNLNIASEIRAIKGRRYLNVEGAIIRDDKILISGDKRYKKNLSENTMEQFNALKKRREEATTEELIDEINAEIDELITTFDKGFVRPQFTKKLQGNLRGKKQKSESVEEKALMQKIYRQIDCPMDRLNQIICENLERARRSDSISIDNILNDYSGKKYDANRVNAIKQEALKGKAELDKLQAKNKNQMEYSYEEFMEERQALIENIIDNIKYSKNNHKERNINEADIVKLINMVYGMRPIRDKNGHEIKNADGSIKMGFTTDRDLKNNQCGMLMLQWVFQAFPETFMKVFNGSKSTVSTVVQTSKGVKGAVEIRGKYYRVETSK